MLCHPVIAQAILMTGSHRDTLNLRIKPQDRAASLLGKTPTDFVLEAARHAAANVLLDRTVFALKPKAYAALLASVDGPSEPNKRLRWSLQTPAPWD
jgi:uncharacterized protein (DUF1778 family)